MAQKEQLVTNLGETRIKKRSITEVDMSYDEKRFL